MGMRAIPIEIRFHPKYEIDISGCWLWTASKDLSGYGLIFMNGRLERAHRVTRLINFNEPIPPNLFACHTCDTRHCVNPDHIFWGTHMENMQDMVSKGRCNPPDSRLDKNPNAKITQTIAEQIREEYVPGVVKQIDLAKKYGLGQTHISRIIRKEQRVEFL